MSVFGTPSTQGLAGAHAAAQQPHARPIRKEPGRNGAPVRADDEVIMGAERVDEADRVQALAGNDQQNAQQDHQQRPGYSRQGPVKPGGRARLDTSG